MHIDVIKIDVISARRNAEYTREALHSCRNEECFARVWKLALNQSAKMKIWIKDQNHTTFKDAHVPQQKTSKRFQALVGECSAIKIF